MIGPLLSPGTEARTPGFLERCALLRAKTLTGCTGEGLALCATMTDMTTTTFNVDPIKPIPIPDEVRLDAGMVLAQKVPAVKDRAEYHKLVVLVRPTTLSKPDSPFDPNNHGRHNVAAWISVRLAVAKSHPHPGLGAGTLFTVPEKQLRRSWRFVGHLGKIRHRIDWDSI